MNVFPRQHCPELLTALVKVRAFGFFKASAQLKQAFVRKKLQHLLHMFTEGMHLELSDSWLAGFTDLV